MCELLVGHGKHQVSRPGYQEDYIVVLFPSRSNLVGRYDIRSVPLSAPSPSRELPCLVSVRAALRALSKSGS
jgi:hypothetical protein